MTIDWRLDGRTTALATTVLTDASGEHACTRRRELRR
jgi:hypothetical protein